jgi:hypothetical protein
MVARSTIGNVIADGVSGAAIGSTTDAAPQRGFPRLICYIEWVRADRTLARDLHRPSQVHGKCWCCSGALPKGRNFFAIKSEVNDHLRDLASNSREIANEHSPRCKRRHVEHRS